MQLAMLKKEKITKQDQLIIPDKLTPQSGGN